MLTRSKTMESINDKNNRSDDDSYPGQTVPPTKIYGPGELSGTKESVINPDSLFNDNTRRGEPANLEGNHVSQYNHTDMMDGAPRVAATNGVRSGIQQNFSASDTLGSKSRGLNSGTSGSSSDLERIADDRDNMRLDRSN